MSQITPLANRSHIASRVAEVLRLIGGASEVYFRGSLPSGSLDMFSDIDIAVAFPSLDAATASREVIDAMESACTIEFADWAPTLLPRTPLVSFFLADVPIHWNVDVQIDLPSEQCNLTAEMIHNDPAAHLLKLWAIALKHVARQDPRAPDEVRKVWDRTIGGQLPANQLAALGSALECISASGRFAAFAARCLQTLHDVQLLRQ